LYRRVGSWRTPHHQQTYQNWNQYFHCWENPTPPSWFREVQRILTSISLFSPIPQRNTEIHWSEESHTPTSVRHRENIGRIGSLKVFWVISVIAVFPRKTWDSMFGGFDSQNTSHSFPHYPNWNMWIPRISRIGLKGWSGEKKGLSDFSL